MSAICPSPPSLLQIEHLTVGYGHVGVVEDVSMTIPEGSIVALVGANGAGKSTMLRAISGLLQPASGRIFLDGVEINGWKPDRVVAAGLLHVAEGRRLFRSQTVLDNLELGLYGAGFDRAQEAARFEAIFELFPILHDRLHARADILSGGQQQMLAIGQALMHRPRVLMLDEPSLGLAPIIVDQVLNVLVQLREGGTSILLVEQMVEQALEIADYGYVMQNGRIIGHGSSKSVQQSDLVQRAYLGVT